MGWAWRRERRLRSISDTGAPNLGEYGWDGTAGTIFCDIDPKDEMVTVLMIRLPPIPIRCDSGSRRWSWQRGRPREAEEVRGSMSTAETRRRKVLQQTLRHCVFAVKEMPDATLLLHTAYLLV